MHRLAAVIVMSSVVACAKEQPAPTNGSSSSSGASANASAPPPLAATKASEFGDVAFKTFRAGTTSIQFTSPTHAENWWSNMVGSTVHGTYEQDGKDIVVRWDPKYTNTGSSQHRFRQMGPCAIAQYERTDRVTGKIIEQTKVFQQVEPRCDTVRLSR